MPVKSPNPAVEVHVPLIKTYLLSKKGEKTWLEPIIDKELQEYHFEVRHGKGKIPNATMMRSGGVCILSNTPISYDYIKAEGQAGRLGHKLIAIVTQSQRNKRYYPATQEQSEIALKSNPEWSPNFSMSTHPQYMGTPRYGLEYFSDLFTNRQLTALSTFIETILDTKEQILKDAIEAGLENDNTPLNKGGQGAKAYAEAIIVYMALALSKWADYLSSVCTWNPTNENISHVFTRQAIPMAWDFAEANAFGDKLSFEIAVEWIASVFDTTDEFGNLAAVVSHGDATRIAIAEDIVICTDPPYYDNVPYADISDFFYVWLRPILKNIYPSIFSTLLVPKKDELVADHERFGSKEKANQHFEEGFKKTFSNIIEGQSNKWPMTVFYAFKQSETIRDEFKGLSTTRSGWETMLEGLIQAGFIINGTWPVRTERTARTRNLGSNALASSIVLVCRQRLGETLITSRREFLSILRHELPIALREMQSGNIAPVDLAQASIGPGMAVYSRYSKVLEPDGSPLTVRTALQIINRELDAYLAELEGEMDTDSRFAVSWFEQFGFDEGGFGQADVLARAKNTSVNGMVSAGVLESGTGKVRLLGWSELDPGWDPESDTRLTVWETVHHLIERLNSHGEEGVARLLAKLSPEMTADARQMAYRLYSVCERKGWAEHARDYNALVVSWGASQEQAREFKEQYQQGSLL